LIAISAFGTKRWLQRRPFPEGMPGRTSLIPLGNPFGSPVDHRSLPTQGGPQQASPLKGDSGLTRVGFLIPCTRARMQTFAQLAGAVAPTPPRKGVQGATAPWRLIFPVVAVYAQSYLRAPQSRYSERPGQRPGLCRRARHQGSVELHRCCRD